MFVRKVTEQATVHFVSLAHERGQGRLFLSLDIAQIFDPGLFLLLAVRVSLDPLKF